MLRVNVKPRKRNSPRIAEKSAPQFLQWLRGRECAAATLGGCDGKIEAAHTYGSGDKGIGTKNRDAYAIPLCATHHAEQHRKGWRTFERERSMWSAPLLAEAYWRAWPGRTAWERKLEAGQ